MLHILWLILKWILILLGILIGLVLLLLLLILFCPVRYRASAEKKRTEGIREIRASGEVSWLLHIISARAFWKEGKIQTKIWVFGVPLSRLKQKLSGKKKKTKTDTSKKDPSVQKKQTEQEKYSRSYNSEEKEETSVIIKEDTTPVEVEEIEGHRYTPDLLEKEPEDKISEILPEQTDACDERDYRREDEISKEIDTSVSEHKETENKNKKRIKDLILKIAGRIKSLLGKFLTVVRNALRVPSRILKKIQKFALTIRKFCDKINWWREFIDHPRTRAAISFLWEDGKKLIHHVLPTRITGKITFGSEDPAVTGTVLALLGMTIPFHKNKIMVNPLFDGENILEGEIFLKGRIYGVVLIKIAIELYFNKNIKYVIHRWRHKEVNHGERE